MDEAEITPANIRFAALSLLATREHSAGEMNKKLSLKFENAEWITQVIQRLAEEGLQSDERFADAFIRMRKRQGKGPLFIARDLKERAISGSLINTFMDASSSDWNLAAALVRRKKFGESLPDDVREKAKQMRFLAARGFTSNNIQYALRCALD